MASFIVCPFATWLLLVYVLEKVELIVCRLWLIFDILKTQNFLLFSLIKFPGGHSQTPLVFIICCFLFL